MKCSSMPTSILNINVFHCHPVVGEEHYCIDSNGHKALRKYFEVADGKKLFYKKIPVICNLDLDSGGSYDGRGTNPVGCQAEKVIP